MRYILAAIICIAVFMIMGFVLSPKLGYQNEDAIKLDEAITSLFFNTHSGHVDNLMILLSMYGREIVWSAVVVYFAIFAGWNGKKIALIIVISFLIIMPLNTILKDFFERLRPDIERPEINVPVKNGFCISIWSCLYG